MAGAGAGDLAAHSVDGHVQHGDELARRDLADDDVVRRGEEVAGVGMLAGEGAEDELRHRHIRGGLDPVPGHVPEHHGEPRVVQT